MNARLTLTTVLLATGCPQIEELDDEAGPAVPAQVQAVFDTRCATPACHDATSAQQGLVLDAESSPEIIGRTATQASMPLVQIGDTQNSWMAIKIQPDSVLQDLGVMRVQDRMPSGITIDETVEAELTVVLGWIGGGEFPGGDTTVGDSGTETGEMLQACGIEDLKAGAPNPIVSGTGAMQIPPDIGEILANNCGCHYADTLDVPVVDYAEGLPLVISTWQEWQTQYPGRPPGTTMGDVVLERIISDPSPFPAMPPPVNCNIGGGLAWTEADRMTLETWINMGTPDGASWMPAGGDTGSTGDTGTTSDSGSSSGSSSSG